MAEFRAYRAYGEQLATDIAAELRGLDPDDVRDGSFIALLIAQGGIAEAMAEDRNLAVGTGRQQIDYALARALVYLGSVQDQDGAAYDREALDRHATALEQEVAAVQQLCMCGRPVPECTDRGCQMGRLVAPGEQRLEEAPLRLARGEG